MTARPPQVSPAALAPTVLDAGEPFSVATTYYRTDHELSFYLRAFRNVAHTRWVVVLALRDGGRVSPADLPNNVRLILTAEKDTNPNDVGWFVPDPVRAVVVGMTGARPDEGLILLFPADWRGPSPDELVEKARRWRSGPHSREDDVFFDATHPY